MTLSIRAAVFSAITLCAIGFFGRELGELTMYYVAPVGQELPNKNFEFGNLPENGVRQDFILIQHRNKIQLPPLPRKRCDTTHWTITGRYLLSQMYPRHQKLARLVTIQPCAAIAGRSSFGWESKGPVIYLSPSLSRTLKNHKQISVVLGYEFGHLILSERHAINPQAEPLQFDLAADRIVMQGLKELGYDVCILANLKRREHNWRTLSNYERERLIQAETACLFF